MDIFKERFNQVYIFEDAQKHILKNQYCKEEKLQHLLKRFRIPKLEQFSVQEGLRLTTKVKLRLTTKAKMPSKNQIQNQNSNCFSKKN